MKPKSLDELGRSRLLLRDARKGRIASGILEAIRTAGELNDEQLNNVNRGQKPLNGNSALADMLRVLLKANRKSLELHQN